MSVQVLQAPEVIVILPEKTNMRSVCMCVCVCVCFLPIHSGHQARWTYRPGSHSRKVTQEFLSTFLLRCVMETLKYKELGGFTRQNTAFLLLIYV